MRASEMLTATEPTAPPIAEELDSLVNRLTVLNENFNSLATDFGVHLDSPEMIASDGKKISPGLDTLRQTITEIKAQISLIEQQHERLFAARTQLFGFGDGQWQAADNPIPNTPGNYAEVRKGDFRTH